MLIEHVMIDEATAFMDMHSSKNNHPDTAFGTSFLICDIPFPIGSWPKIV
jgi:hypothetical protein